MGFRELICWQSLKVHNMESQSKRIPQKPRAKLIQSLFFSELSTEHILCATLSVLHRQMSLVPGPSSLSREVFLNLPFQQEP